MKRLAALLATAMLLALQTATAAEQAVPARFFGVHLHRADTSTPWPFVRFGSWRLWDAGVDWASLEPSRGLWRFDRLDRLMALAETNGVEPVLTLGVTPQWAAARPQEPFVYGPGGASEPRDLADWERYVRRVAQRYKGRLPNLEVWNEPKYSDIEPTTGGFFSGTVKDLVDLACAAQRAAREVDPAIRIVGPGFTGAGDRLERFLAAGGKHCIDVVGFHFYAATPEKMRQHIEQVRRIMREQDVAHMPLWNTEAGYETVAPGSPVPGPQGFGVSDKNIEAIYTLRSLVLAADADVQRFHFYSWERTLDKDLQPGRTAQAVATAVRWLDRAQSLRCQDQGRAWVCAIERGGRKAWLLWSTGGDRNWQIPPAWQVRAIEPMEGEGLPWTEAQLTIGPAPVLLKQEATAWTP